MGSRGRRHSSASQVVDRPRAEIASSATAFPDLEAWLIEASQSPDAQEQNETPASRKAVSLRVHPDLVLALRQALVLVSGIKAAFVHGPIAQGKQSPTSEIELMVIVDATHVACFGGLDDAENLLKRRIRANFVSEQEWRRELLRGNAYFTKVDAQPRVVIFASADDLLG